jgi:hypothetical protein
MSPSGSKQPQKVDLFFLFDTSPKRLCSEYGPLRKPNEFEEVIGNQNLNY